MKLPADVRRVLVASSGESVVAMLSTSRLDGEPNVLPSPFTDVVGDDLVLLPDLFAQKTKVNLNENRAAALSFATPAGALPWVLEGVADVIQWGHPDGFGLFGVRAGEILESWGDWDEMIEPVLDASELSARPSVYAQRGVIVFKTEHIVEVSECY
jgi:hypothetical protein